MVDILPLADRIGVWFTEALLHWSGCGFLVLIVLASTGGLYLRPVLCVQKASKGPILEEAELDFRPLEECDEGLEEEDVQPPETKETQNEAKREADRKEGRLQNHSGLDSYN